MQVMWLVLVTLGAGPRRNPGARGDNPRNRLGQAPVTAHPPSFAGPWLEWSSGARLGAEIRRQQSPGLVACRIMQLRTILRIVLIT